MQYGDMLRPKIAGTERTLYIDEINFILYQYRGSIMSGFHSWQQAISNIKRAGPVQPFVPRLSSLQFRVIYQFDGVLVEVAHALFPGL